MVPGTGVTEPSVWFTIRTNKYKKSSTIYVYWHNRRNGKQPFYNAKKGFQNAEIDLFGKAGKPKAVKLNQYKGEFRLFGPEGEFGPLPNDIPTKIGRYQFVIEIRDEDGVEFFAGTADAKYVLITAADW